MKQLEDEALDFVVRHYQEHTYHTGDAIKAFRKLTGTSLGMNTRRIWAIAASLAIIVGLAITLLYKYHQERDLICLSSSDHTVTYLLQDGSKITLAPNTTLSYHADEIQEGERMVTLQGKAFFTVYHDVQHPFIVETENGKIQVLGTKFQVEAQAHETQVLVDKGKVSFYKDMPQKGILLTQGMGAALETGQEKPHRISNPNNSTSWATGLFHFDHTPLKRALADISNYCGVHVQTDSSDKNISGDLEIKDAEEAKELLESLFDIKIYIDK